MSRRGQQKQAFKEESDQEQIDDLPEKTEESIAEPTIQKVQVLCTTLNVRERDSKMSSILFTVHRGEILEVLRPDEEMTVDLDWLWVQAPNQKSGFVMRDLVKEI